MLLTAVFGGIFVVVIFIGYQLARFEKQVDEDLKR